MPTRYVPPAAGVAAAGAAVSSAATPSRESRGGLTTGRDPRTLDPRRQLGQTRRVRVVVAEDVMLTREGIVRVLGDAGIDVVGEAADVDALMHAVAAERPDCAIVDIRMP